ncbi:MAG: hypothetical protein JO277_09925 [Candidatus Eremiobacteraeota bacterium]|nr:hypothetical protein [Candidatus Eremiobacteraeota bacterium]
MPADPIQPTPPAAPLKHNDEIVVVEDKELVPARVHSVTKDGQFFVQITPAHGRMLNRYLRVEDEGKTWVRDRQS